MIGELTSFVSEQTPPPVMRWFKVYLGAMIILYTLCLLGGLVLIWCSRQSSGEDRFGLMLQGALLSICGPPFAIAHALPFFLPRKPWVWIYNLVLICGGMTSCCCLPASIPLLIYWIKPETKVWFNRT